MRFSTSFISSLVLIGSIIGCKTIEPIAPQTVEQTAPIADQPTSIIVLPITVNLAEYYQLADKEVPTKFDGQEQHCEGVSFNYHFERDPLKLQANNRDIDINVSGKYRIKMNYCPNCTDLFSTDPHCVIPRVYFSCGHGEPMRRMSLKYTSHIEITPDYGILTKTKLTDLKAIDPCEVTVFQFDATDELLKEVRKSLGQLAKDIDLQTSKITFKSTAKGLWKQAETPFAVPGYGFVQLHPSALHLSNPIIRNNILTTSLVLEAKPKFTSERPTANYTSLPLLNVTEKIPNDTLQLYTDLHLDYDSLSTIINRFIGGTSLNIQKKNVILDSIRITGANNKKLIFKVAFSGDKRGVLFITGKPSFNAVLQQIELTEVDFDIETKSVLLKTAKWLFSDRILNEITKSSKQDLKPQLNLLLKELNKSLHFEQNGFRISGLISHMVVEHLYPETDRLIVRVAATGTLGMTNLK